MKIIMSLFLLLVTFFSAANVTPSENDISNYLNEICKSTPNYFLRKLNATNIVDKSESSLSNSSQSDIAKYKLDEKYKDLNDDSFKNYLTIVNIKAVVKDNASITEAQIVGACLFSVVGDDIANVSANLSILLGDAYQDMPTDVMSKLLHKKTSDLKLYLDQVNSFK